MAYPTIDKPYGLKPINLIGGQVFAGQTRQYVIASGYGTSIFNGDVVKIVSTGTIEKDTGQATATPVGIFMGCSYVNAQGQVIFAQYFPASTTAPTGTVITAYVADDPDQLFKAVLVSGNTEDGNGLTPAFLGRTMIGSNAELVQNTGVTATGDSRIGVYTAAGATTTATLPIRIIDVVPDTANSSGNFCEVICKWNAPSAAITIDFTAETASVSLAGGHQYLNPTGV
jgi:hypothetical protein